MHDIRRDIIGSIAINRDATPVYEDVAFTFEDRESYWCDGCHREFETIEQAYEHADEMKAKELQRSDQ